MQPAVPQNTPAQRRAFLLHVAAYVLTGIGIVATSIKLLRHRGRIRDAQPPEFRIRSNRSATRRTISAGLETLTVLLPILIELRHKKEPAPQIAEPRYSVAYRIGAYALPILLCLALGALAGWLQRPALTEWYPALLKPAGTPPNWLFPVAWSIIYVAMGISAGRILTASDKNRHGVLTLWGIQLGVNFLWSMLFFVARSPLLGMIDIAVLDALAMLYIARSYGIRRDAAWLFAPYLAWLLYATYLNAWILAANGPGI